MSKVWLFCLALTAVSVSATPVAPSWTCDDDLLYWAREDIFLHQGTVDLDDALTTCGNNLPSWLNPVPCKNSCEELICKYSCAARNLDFVNKLV